MYSCTVVHTISETVLLEERANTVMNRISKELLEYYKRLSEDDSEKKTKIICYYLYNRRIEDMDKVDN